MAALQDSGSSKDHGAKQAGVGGEPKRKRARSVGVVAGGASAASASAGVHRENKGSSTPAASQAPAPSSASPARPESAAGSLADVTVNDADALDCGVCFLPLKPPIFQCEVGHVVCSPCCDKLKATGKCHVCGVATGSYRRCHDMERLVASICVPCLHAAHGCTARPAYHDQEGHRLACPHAPCHCPGEACSFVGSTAMLVDHFSAVHSWPCITKVKANEYGELIVSLSDGFNFLLADCSTGNNQGVTTSVQCLLLLTVARQPLGRTISVLRIDPHAATAGGGQELTSTEMECELRCSLYANLNSIRGGNPLIRHYQDSCFRVACTDLSNGLPKPEDCFQFLVPNSHSGEHDKNVIQVTVRIVIK